MGYSHRHILMAASRAYSSVSVAWCNNCRFALLSAFTSCVDVSVRPTLRPVSQKNSSKQLVRTRSFASQTPWRSELVRENDEYLPNKESEELLGSEHVPDLENKSNPTSSIPWYLQVDPPDSSYKSLSERQRLPELPLDPPPLLQPVLEYISIDLGLEDLSIFDLRNVDPPPALGTNLLMVLGTARSEKHLHVSADRFCRWLRTTHKLSPYPDGLLGRGELKRKLRRKNRRARLLSSVGASESSTVDDGLRTGWVCVNVGIIDDGRDANEQIQESEGFVGFGEQVSGAKVVIQMLTAEKREELDLEDLWGGILVRQQKRDARRLNGEDEALQQADSTLPNYEPREEESEALKSEVGRDSSLLKGQMSDTFCHSPIRPSIPSHPSSLQLRGFHSHPRSSTADINGEEKTTYEGRNSSGIELGIQTQSNEPSSNPLDTSLSYTYQFKDPIAQSHDTANFISLQALVLHLENSPCEDAMGMLGFGINDHSSTPFLREFYHKLPMFSDATDWECRLSLICCALKLAHPNYHKADLFALFSEMQASVINVPRNVFMMIFKMLLTRRGEMSLSKQRLGLSGASVEFALRVLADMDLRGHNIITEEILTEVMVATLFKTQHAPAKPDVPHRFTSHAVQRLLKGLSQHIMEPGAIFVNVETHIRLLNAYADANNWSGFWNYWKGIARAMQRRPKDLYLVMFRRAAETGHQAHIMRNLRHYVPRMRREEPPVELDAELAKVIMDCVLVAEPDVVAEAREGQSEMGEWVKLWRSCELPISRNDESR